ncbi:MAG: hypothetical protein WA783_17215 [Phormidesmis sp.]
MHSSKVEYLPEDIFQKTFSRRHLPEDVLKDLPEGVSFNIFFSLF